MSSVSSKRMRLDRLLSNLGYGGRQEAAMAVKNGRVSVEGTVVKDPATNISLQLCRVGLVLLDGQAIDPPQPFTIMLHKPAGYTCSREDAGHLVYDLLPRRWMARKPILSTIGRLDKESSGQLLLTDDGDLLHRIISPKTNTPKQYHVTLRDDVRGDEADVFATGTFCLKGDKKPLKPALWTPGNAREGVMVLSEGRYHQIRRMFEEIGNEVVTLHRFQTGGLRLGDLEEGAWRVLNDDDIASIFTG